MDGLSKKDVSKVFSSATNSKGMLKPTKHTIGRGDLPSHFQVSWCNAKEFQGSVACVEALLQGLAHFGSWCAGHASKEG